MSRESFDPKVEKPEEIKSESLKSPNLEGEKKEKNKRSLREIIELKDKLRFVAKMLSKNFDLKVVPGDGWAAGLSEKFQRERLKYPDKSLEEFDPELLTPEIMKYPEKDFLERSEDYIWGVFRHEMGHIKHSDYQSLIESQVAAKKEGYDPMDLFLIYDAWEDGRSNNMEGQTSKAAHYRLGIYLKEDIAETLLLDLEERPLPIQYGALCWAKGAESFIEGFNFEELKAKIKDEHVLRAFEETRGVLDEYLNESKGRKAFTEVLWQRGWPIFKELIKKHIEGEAKQDYNKQQEQSEASEVPEEGDQGDEYGERESEAKSGVKAWDELSDQEKEGYIKAARENLTEQEREFVKQIQPRSVQMNEREDGIVEATIKNITNEDIKNAEQEESEYEKVRREVEEENLKSKHQEIEEAKKSLEKLKEHESGLTEAEREQYEKYYAEVKKYISPLVEKLDEVFPLQEGVGWEGGQIRGKRVQMRGLAREIPTGRGKIFEKKELPEIKEAAFTLLIDISFSMVVGQKIEEALKAAILMAEALSRRNLPFEILAFNAKLLELKGFKDKYFGKKKVDLLRVLQEVRTRSAGYNDDGYAIDVAARRLQRQLLDNDAQGALIVFSDGQPHPSDAHAGPEWELHGIVNKWSKKVPLIGVGIGPNMKSTIEKYYGKNGLSVPDVTKLPRALLDILKRQFARFEK